MDERTGAIMFSSVCLVTAERTSAYVHISYNVTEDEKGERRRITGFYSAAFMIKESSNSLDKMNLCSSLD